MRRWIVGPALGAALLFGAAGCGARSVRAGEDLASRFVAVDPGVERSDGTRPLIREMPVTRRGRRLPALVLVAPARARAPIGDLAGGRPVRLFGLATPVYNLGDGARLEVRLVDGSAQARLLSRTFDAARHAADRDWIPIELVLPAGVRPGALLEIEVSAGPRGDLVGDWVALAGLEIRP